MEERSPEEILKQLGWTADFSQFTKKLEPIFGPLDCLAVRNPELYAHHVLSHGFMEYAGVTGLPRRLKQAIASSEEKFGRMLAEQRGGYGTRYRGILKEEYLKWARANNLPESLLEAGWKEYLDD